MTRLSAILITKNAASHIESCLDSLHGWVDEIIIVDGGSTDDTVARCNRYPVKLYVHEDWLGFGVQKNRALAYAQGDWVLSIDADEAVPTTLQQEILHATKQDRYVAFQMPRCSSYCGRWIRHSGWQPDYVLRLFRRDAARFSNALVHEQVQVSHGAVGRLKTPLSHYSFNSLEEVLDKVNAYSTASAQMRFQQGKRGSLRKAIAHGMWAFVRTYLLQRGFLDGREGFMLAVSNAEGTYYRYLKLMYLGQQARVSTQHQSHHHHL